MAALKAQIAVVTGASSGIGRAIALALANEGATVCLVGRSLERLQAVAACSGQFADRFSLFKADLGVDEDIYLLRKNFQKKFRGIDVLVHSAGVIAMGEIRQASVQDFDKQYKINLRAAYLMTQVFLPALKRRGGQVAFINSSAGLKAKGGVGQYAATKFALKAVADSLREEVNADGIRVLSVYPGRTASPMQQNIHAMEKKSYLPENLIQAEDVASVLLNSLKLPRTAEVTDIRIRCLKK